MSEEIKNAEELIDFLYDSPTAFHGAENIKNILLKEGYKELKEEEKWNIEKGGKYFTTKNESAIIAFNVGIGEIEENGFKLIGAHTDAPSFRIKPNPEMTEGKYLKLNTEVYGGPILNTWFDRPLAVAGRVALKGENPLKPEIRLVNIKKPIMIIPNLCIHMNRGVNEGIAINRQKDVLPFICTINESCEKDNYLVKLVGEELGVEIEDIIDFDLFLYEYEKGCLFGVNNEFISSGRLDDLSMCHAGLRALLECKETKGTNVLVCFDNEEVGSSTKQGAHSPLLSNTLERIVLALGKGKEEFFRSLANSFIISADLAHAVHPNYGEKADPINRPIINGGPVIKIAANQSYSSDSVSSAIYKMVCKNAGVPVQTFVNRSDTPGGSTIGPLNSRHLNIKSVDMGSPVFAMHSIREMGGVLDHTYSIKSFTEFFNL